MTKRPGKCPEKTKSSSLLEAALEADLARLTHVRSDGETSNAPALMRPPHMEQDTAQGSTVCDGAEPEQTATLDLAAQAPTCDGGMTARDLIDSDEVLRRFSPIQMRTHCPFARKAKNVGMKQAGATYTDIHTALVRVSNPAAALDGLVLELEERHRTVTKVECFTVVRAILCGICKVIIPHYAIC